MKVNSIVEGFFYNSEKTPDKTALIWGNEKISYEEVSECILKVAGFLKNQGVSEGDRVAFYGEKSPLFLYTYFATHLIKAIAVPLDIKLPNDRLADLISQTEPRILLHPTDISHSFKQHPFGKNLLDAEPLKSLEFPDKDLSADILFTTGTTGSSKGVKLTHHNILAGAENSNIFIGNNSSDTEIIPLPLHHAFGLRRLRTNMLLGATVVLVDGFIFPKLFFDAIENYGANGICMVPAGFSIVKKLMKRTYIDYFKKLKYMEFGSSSMENSEKKDLAEALPDTRICMHYGLTEVAANIFIEFHDDDSKLNALGKPSPNILVKIVSDDGIEQPTKEVGEIVVKGAVQTPGYWKKPELTNDSFINGWFKTGDLGFADEEGYIFLSGRKDDVMNIGGKKVFPGEIEEIINQHILVKDSACISVKESGVITGEMIKAFVVPENKEKLDLKELMSFLREKLEPYKIPSEIIFISRIPHTSSGKKQRDKLK